ncbi:hypothetical protein LZ30DRAFT_398508 [Colletotrichum cereale]|nr:hypothetical protein LZ30DRAFT_398508 [Colletotrichum cereale]
MARGFLSVMFWLLSLQSGAHACCLAKEGDPSSDRLERIGARTTASEDDNLALRPSVRASSWCMLLAWKQASEPWRPPCVIGLGRSFGASPSSAHLHHRSRQQRTVRWRGEQGRRQGECGPSLIRPSPSPLPDHQQGRQPRHWVQCVVLDDLVRRVIRPIPCFFFFVLAYQTDYGPVSATWAELRYFSA